MNLGTMEKLRSIVCQHSVFSCSYVLIRFFFSVAGSNRVSCTHQKFLRSIHKMIVSANMRLRWNIMFVSHVLERLFANDSSEFLSAANVRHCFPSIRCYSSRASEPTNILIFGTRNPWTFFFSYKMNARMHTALTSVHVETTTLPYTFFFIFILIRNHKQASG